MTDGVQAAIVARIAEVVKTYTWYPDMAAEVVAGALGLPAILSIVEERRNAHRCQSGWCFRCVDRYPCDERKALDEIHNHLTGVKDNGNP